MSLYRRYLIFKSGSKLSLWITSSSWNGLHLIGRLVGSSNRIQLLVGLNWMMRSSSITFPEKVKIRLSPSVTLKILNQLLLPYSGSEWKMVLRRHKSFNLHSYSQLSTLLAPLKRSYGSRTISFQSSQNSQMTTAFKTTTHFLIMLLHGSHLFTSDIN